MSETIDRSFFSALPPTEAEAAAWKALSREEQLARFRDAMLAPDVQRVTDATMTHVLAKARAVAAARRG